jgi:tetratricopeptide (TPR) repeat protein
MRLKVLPVIFLFISFSAAVIAQRETDDLIKSGNQKDSLKNFTGAINDFSAAIRQDSGNYSAFYYRGYVYYELKEYTNAINDFSESIKLDSLDIEALFNRGNAKFELKHYKGAIQDYTSALSLNPKDKECYYNRAIAEYSGGNSDDACTDLEKASKLGDAMAKEVIREICR